MTNFLKNKKAPTAAWVNVTFGLVLARFLFEGATLSIPGFFEWTLAPLDPTLILVLTSVPSVLYGQRRWTDAKYGTSADDR